MLFNLLFLSQIKHILELNLIKKYLKSEGSYLTSLFSCRPTLFVYIKNTIVHKK